MKLLHIILICIIILLGYFAYYDYNMKKSVKKRRNVPWIHRRSILDKIIEIISKAASVSNTKPFLVYGTLLGYIRNKDFICYDFDVDVAVKTDDYVLLHSAIKNIIEEYPDFKLDSRSLFGYKMFLVIHKATGINGDVFEIVRKGDHYKRNVPDLYSKYYLGENGVTYQLDWIDTLKQVQFNNHNIYIPNQPEKLLTLYYGEDFMTPDHMCSVSCDNCVKV